MDMAVSAVVDRHLAPRVEEALAASRIVNLIGPRQAGKSTLVERQIEVAEYLTMDDDAVRASIEADPFGQLQALVQRHAGRNLPIAMDEVQRVPGITLALKRIVDRDRRPGQFLLTGSADIFTIAAAMDSLAGRVMTLTLRPFSAAEIMGAGPCLLLDAVGDDPAAAISGLPRPLPFSREDALDLVVRGGYPEIRGLPDRIRRDRYNSYIDSIIVRDVPAIAPIRKPDMLKRLIRHLADWTAEESNVARIVNAVGVTKPTVNDWLDVPERVGLIHRLPAWTSSRAGRDIRARKLHFADTGCATALRGEGASSFGIGGSALSLSRVLESYLVGELEKLLPLASKTWTLNHWRMETREIDIVAEGPGRELALFDVKASTSIAASDFRTMDWFLTSGPGRGHRAVAFVVYLGNQLVSMGPGRIALPLSILWSYPQAEIGTTGGHASRAPVGGTPPLQAPVTA
jgi:predicted AAA+ superfamily ATPase